MEPSQYKNLLDQVTAINARYKKINELTGENFNVFRILKLESSEVRMHSAFIAELLNPKGSHGQKDVFLQLFVDAFCFKENQIDVSSCKIKVEESIGTISEDGTKGGRIDIVITDRQYKQIVIENKIYAGDQNYQLTRYYNYSDKADLIYLTLDGKLPSEGSKGQLKEGVHYKCYSYQHDILNWLELCRKEVAVYPIVREAITHYINLIKYLTGQTINKNMQEELSNLIKANLEASFAIYNNLDKTCDNISDEFGKLLIKRCLEIGLICEYDIEFKNRYNGFWVYKPEWKSVNIGFQFQNYDKDLIYGIVTDKHPIEFPIPEDLKNIIKLLPNNTPKNNDWWPWFKYMEGPYNNWEQLEAWQAILDGRMMDAIIEKIKYLLEITKDISL